MSVQKHSDYELSKIDALIVDELMDSVGSDRPQSRTALVGREL